MNNTQLWTALITPMRENGDVDLDDLASLIHRQDDAGNGVLVLGSTGEGLALDQEDKKNIVKTAANLNIDIPIMVGVGGFNLHEQIEWIEYCQEFDIDGFLLVTPLYSKPNLKGQVAWFKGLLDAAGKPCMIYNVPSRTGVKLYPQVLNELKGHPNLSAVKEASGSIEEYQEFRKAAPDLAFYSGDDSMTPFFAVAGCNGLVSVVANVWPEATHRYVEWCLEGRGSDLLPLWQECTDAMFLASNPIPVKVLLKEKGWIKSAALRPPLTVDDLKDFGSVKKADQQISNWLDTTNQNPN